MVLLEGIRKGMSLLSGLSTSTSSAEADFLNLCQQNVYSIQALVIRGNLLNEMQCRDLSQKLFKTVHSIQELVFHCGGSSDRFRRALERFYRILEKAELLVKKCSKDDWITEAVFQIENAKDFQVILLEVGLCYHAVYEQAKDVSGNLWNFQHLGQGTSAFTFRPASADKVREDQDTLKRRLVDLVRSRQISPIQLPVQQLQQCLAKYLLVTWECISRQTQTNELDLSSIILCMKEIESSETWGKDQYLGSGSFGGVCKSTWMSIPCAKKVFHGEVDESLFLKEAGILFHLKHTNVVKFFCCGNGQDREDCFMAMELMEKSLAKLILDQAKKGVPFSYQVSIEIIAQIARGMCYLHGMGVAHRDLKPPNVVINKLTSPYLEDQYCVKLVDFGLSKVRVEACKSNVMTGAGIGTTKYRAPEAHRDGPGRVNWFKADVYSFGVTCAHLLSLKDPFENVNLGNKYVELMNGLRPEIPATACPEKLVALINNCWDTCPISRPSFTEICIRLEEITHELLRGGFGGLSSPNQGYKQEMQIDCTSYDFIRIEVEEHSAVQRQGIPCTDEIIELKPTLDSSVIVNRHLETIKSFSSSTTDVSNFHSSAFGASSTPINKVAVEDLGITEHASTIGGSEYLSACTELVMPGTQGNGRLADNHHRELSSTPEAAGHFSNQCKVLKEHLVVAEAILNKETESSDDVSSADISVPQSALTELHRVVKIGKALIESCHNEPCQKAYLRQDKRIEAFAEALKDVVWCVSVVYYHNIREFSPRNLAMTMDTFPQAVLGAKEQYLLQKAVFADKKELHVSLHVWIQNHSCSAEECGRAMDEHEGADDPSVCLANQILARLANSKDDIIAGPVETDHISDTLWKTTQEVLEDIRRIGGGALGIVFETTWLGDKYAKKVVDVTDSTCHAVFVNEANALATLNHPHIVSIFAYSVSSSETCFFLMELMSHDLHKYILNKKMKRLGTNSPFSILASIDLMLQISEAMSYMNSQGMVHRFLTSYNILVKEVDDPVLQKEGFVLAKLGGFSSALSMPEVVPYDETTRNVDPGMWPMARWMAPEIWCIEDHHRLPSDHTFFPRKCDVYSYGIVFSEVLTGNLPFHNAVFNARELHQFSTALDNPWSSVRPELPESCPESLASLIRECWHTDPVRRPTFEEISRTLRYLKGLHILAGIHQ
ncbi:hypothetical protein KC19_10G121800 [Ceratodon purpureus]|uniref:Protein kinase domain-containing protein n=1 Tax=Ceratodon purpureus TaxID=3225 RepID=A0A8T0GJG1_CERPU|nr:hypothetical protein KC19_10G121800 [Ceratodon purpureus]